MRARRIPTRAQETATAGSKSASKRRVSGSSQSVALRQLFDRYAQAKNFASWQDWYQVNPNDVLRSEEAEKILAQIRRPASHALHLLVLLAYPEQPWQPWRFKWSRLPWGWWKSIENQGRFLDSVAGEFRFPDKAGFYRLAKSQVIAHGGGALMKMYGHSVAKAAMTAFPEHRWQAWEFEKTPSGWWADKQNQLQYMTWLTKEQLKFNSFDDFYKLHERLFRRHKGRALLAKYKGIPHLLRELYPEVDWKPWLFPVRVEWFAPRENQLQFISWLKSQQNLTTMEDFYSLTTAIVIKNGGTGLGLLEQYGGSLFSMLKGVYPTHKWMPWKLHMSPGVWAEESLQLDFLRWFGQEILKITYPPNTPSYYESWYKASYQDLVDAHGSSIMRIYKGSPFAMLSRLYPKHEWLPWRFKAVPKHWWSLPANQRKYLEWLFKKLEYTQLADFYSISHETFLENGGAGFANLESITFAELIAKAYPEHKWELWKFEKSPVGWWKNPTNQRLFLEAFLRHRQQKDPSSTPPGATQRTQLSPEELNQLYYVSIEELTKFAGFHINFHVDSMATFVASAFPKHEWRVWKFQRVPAEFWQSQQNLQLIANHIKHALHFDSLEDWYSVTKDQMMDLGGRNIASRFPKPVDFLRVAYPEHQWKAEKFGSEREQPSLRVHVSGLLELENSTKPSKHESTPTE